MMWGVRTVQLAQKLIGFLVICIAEGLLFTVWK